MSRSVTVLLSVGCALVFVFIARAHPAPLLAVVLNLVLAAGCIALLLTKAAAPPRIGRNAIVALLVVLYIGASLAKLNGSSSALWRQFADEAPAEKGIIAGAPREIRMDEWLVQTPWLFAQAKHIPPFPVANSNVGNGLAPLVTNLPVAHWTMLFRPQMWGFFCLDLERAFAFNWNFKWFGLLLGGFLFFGKLTRGNDFLALSGALLMLFSAYVQWFFSTPTCMPEMVAMVFFGLWAVDIVMHAQSRARIIGASAVLLAAILQFVFCCYPRFQVPLLYMAAALLIACGYRKPDLFRIAALAITLAIAAALLWLWIREIEPTLAEIRSLAYPGQSFSTGGGFAWYFFFAPLLEFSLSEEHFPAAFVNVCEASGFLFLGPLLVAACIRDGWRRRLDPVLLGLVVFLTVTSLFMIVGMPAWLARITGWSYLTPMRCLLALGVASIVGTIRYLSRDSSHGAPAWRAAFLIAPALFAGLYLTNARLGHFAPPAEVIAAAIFFASVGGLLWKRAALPACVLLLVPLVCAYGFVNPIAQGLPGLTRGDMQRWITSVHQAEPHARWLVTGGQTLRTCFLPQLLKATGAAVLGGTRAMPDREMLRVLDPENRFGDVHNRYARSWFPAAPARAEVASELQAIDAYLVRLPLRQDLLDQLQITFVLLVDSEDDAAALPGFTRIGQRHGCQLFRRL